MMRVLRAPVLTALCVALLVLLVPLKAAQQSQRPTFRSTSNGVLVNAFVLSSGAGPAKPVDGLTSADFRLTDNGKAQDVSVAPAAGPIDLTLVVDGGADAARYADEFRQSLRVLAAGLHSADRIRVLVCSGVVREVVPMQLATSPISAEALATIGSAGSPYGSAVIHGLFDAMVHEADPERRQLVLAVGTFTGHDVFGPEALVSIATSSDAVVYVALEPTGTPIFPEMFQTLGRVVATTGGALLIKTDRSTRTGLPSSFRFSPAARGASGGALVTSFTTLRQVVSVIMADLNHGYVLSYSPPDGTTPGWHDLKVQVTRGFASVRARKRYFAAPHS